MSKQPVASFMAPTETKVFYSHRRFNQFFRNKGFNGFAIDKLWSLSQDDGRSSPIDVIAPRVTANYGAKRGLRNKLKGGRENIGQIVPKAILQPQA